MIKKKIGRKILLDDKVPPNTKSIRVCFLGVSPTVFFVKFQQPHPKAQIKFRKQQ